MDREPTVPRPPAASRWFVVAQLAVLVVLTFAAYSRVAEYGFLLYDDPKVITENAHVQEGLSKDSILWAFTTTHAYNWVPVAWLSHMLDVQIFGMHPAGHHRVSLAIHTINALTLFLVLRSLTGASGRSFLVAALFAIHPLHVESVAWITERRTLISAFAWFLSIAVWRRCATRRDARWYAVAAAAFLFGFMAKPTILPLPITLLLLDFWPLGRFSAGWGPRITAAVAEKIPLFAMASLFALITVLTQWAGGAITSTTRIPVGARFGNALVSYVVYLGQTLWPNHLAMFYPHPGDSLALWKVVAAALLLGAITTGVLLDRRRPYLAFGWLWYLVTLAPVIGIVQTGTHAMADRYTYVPLVGIFLMVSWGLFDLSARWPHRLAVRGLAVAAVLAALIPVTRAQADRWRDDISLNTHALAVEPRNPVAHNNLGLVLAAQGQWVDAVAHYREAIRIDPLHVTSYSNLGAALMTLGRVDEAMANLRAAVRLNSSYKPASRNLALALLKLGNAADREGRLQDALAFLLEATKLEPDNTAALIQRGRVYNKIGRPAAAITSYQEALQHDPNSEEARFNLALCYLGTNQKAARAEYEVLRKLRSPRAEQLRVFLEATPWPGERTDH